MKLDSFEASHLGETEGCAESLCGFLEGFGDNHSFVFFFRFPPPGTLERGFPVMGLIFTGTGRGASGSIAANASRCRHSLSMASCIVAIDRLIIFSSKVISRGPCFSRLFVFFLLLLSTTGNP
ncbi:hypothetical protein JWJ90_13665 [Desulfobulbus rhabdoformis]|uniref:hypothetical protein n=1 Tax=Desulfobulbus rhabdoformis TaxID=34032 RepID=UPI001962AB90|nr:hypothetical protein [Desulfobulbus rhabdoformis]MBM9615327.1 hypothetical protein [Desulfobulbus rhabdoformis]